MGILVVGDAIVLDRAGTTRGTSIVDSTAFRIIV